MPGRAAPPDGAPWVRTAEKLAAQCLALVLYQLCLQPLLAGLRWAGGTLCGCRTREQPLPQTSALTPVPAASSSPAPDPRAEKVLRFLQDGGTLETLARRTGAQPEQVLISLLQTMSSRSP